MKKLLTGITLASLLVAPAIAVAQTGNVPDMTGGETIDALERLVDWLFTILLIVAVIFLVIAAFGFITASGDPEKVAKSRNFVLYALIGVAVAVAARGLVALVELIMNP